MALAVHQHHVDPGRGEVTDGAGVTLRGSGGGLLVLPSQVVGSARLGEDPHRVVRPTKEPWMGDWLRRTDGSSLLPGPDLLYDGFLYDLLLLLLDLLWISEY